MAEVSNELLDEFAAAAGAVAAATTAYSDARRSGSRLAAAEWLNVVAARLRYEEVNSKIDEVINRP